MASISLAPVREFKVGERVEFTVRFNNPGHFKPGDKIKGTVICVFENSGELSYRVELDVLWSDRLPQVKGQKIIAGNIRGSSLKTTDEDFK